MITLVQTTPQLESLLHRMCATLQISRTQHALAEQRYHTISKILSEDEHFKDAHIDIYSQGSLRTGTTVRPQKQQEFDLDFVLEVRSIDETKLKNPVQFLNDVTAILMKHDQYKHMTSPKNRCVRITYANDFHMDILPGRPTEGNHPNCIEVPDRKAEEWKPSNPKGYADWFEDKAINFQKVDHYFLLEKSASIEPLPDIEPLELKPPLKRAIQLLKRHRDIVFEDDLENAPISIVLTTLAGELYTGQGSVYEALLGILNGIVTRIKTERFIRVYNPKNSEELLSERWEDNPEMYQKFVSFITLFAQRWSSLPEKTMNAGQLQLSEQLGTSFGSELVKKSMASEAIISRHLQEKGHLKMTPSGLIVPVTAPISSSIPLRTNTFYGKY